MTDGGQVFDVVLDGNIEDFSAPRLIPQLHDRILHIRHQVAVVFRKAEECAINVDLGQEILDIAPNGVVGH